MSRVTNHTYPGLQRHQAELQQMRGMRVATLRQEYDRLAAVSVAERTPWQRMRLETLRLTLGISGATR